MSSRPSWITIAKRFAPPVLSARFYIPTFGPAFAGMLVLANATHIAWPGRVALGGFLITASLWLYALLLRLRHGSFHYRHWVGAVEANVRIAMEIDDIGRFLPQNQAAIEDWCGANCKGHWRINHVCVEFECDEDAVLFYMFHGMEPPKPGPRKPTPSLA